MSRARRTAKALDRILGGINAATMLFAVVETWRPPRHPARFMEHRHATALWEMEEHHEHDLPYIQMVRSDSVRVHGRNSAQLRIDGRRRWWDEIRSVRSSSHGAESRNVTSTTLHKLGFLRDLHQHVTLRLEIRRAPLQQVIDFLHAVAIFRHVAGRKSFWPANVARANANRQTDR
jgi:hypothetical protein